MISDSDEGKRKNGKIQLNFQRQLELA